VTGDRRVTAGRNFAVGTTSVKINKKQGDLKTALKGLLQKGKA